ncbi:MAG: hypothetical protein OIN87_02145 [Candidatus Methanoperedens sp.]|nr:hypothetical protein [Candidatus Methanoperedens sp.]
MEKSTNDTQDLIDKAIWKFLETNKELVIRRIIGADGLALTAGTNKNITIDTSGTGKALYNGVELGGGSNNKIVGSGCALSLVQPTVECSPDGAQCEINVTAGKTGKIVFKRST